MSADMLRTVSVPLGERLADALTERWRETHPLVGEVDAETVLAWASDYVGPGNKTLLTQVKRRLEEVRDGGGA